MRDNWTIVIEGLGPTHDGEPGSADSIMLSMLDQLKKNHEIWQARFTGRRGEENWIDPIHLNSHIELCETCKAAKEDQSKEEPSFKKEPEEDPHESLVSAGVRATVTRGGRDAARK